MGIVTKKRSPGIAKRREGFTLLELLVVVGILATLVALALPYYQDYINQSRITAAQADLNTFSKALALYDQNEPTMFNATNFLPLIGKYVQDFRTYPTQTMPKDPWGNDYIVKPMQGTLICCGPDGTDQTLTARVAAGDDLIVTYKPPFFISTARGINATMLELVFSRRVDDTTVTNGAVTGVTNVTGTSSSKQKIGPTIYRFLFTAPNGLASPGTNLSRRIEVITTIKSQDGQSIDTDVNPLTGLSGYIATFTY